MKRIVMGMLIVGAMAMIAMPAQAQNFPYSLNYHWGNPPLTTFACTPAVDLPDAILSCSIFQPDLFAFPPPTGTFQHLWVVLGGVDTNASYNGVGAVQFGVTYTPNIIANPLWNNCTGGSVITTSGIWPTSGSSAAITWSGGCYNVAANSDGLTKVGFITAIAGPFFPGSFQLVEDPTTVANPAFGVPAAVAGTCPPPLEIRICKQLLGTANVGIPGGVNTCGFVCGTPTEEQSWGALKSIYNN